MNYRDMLRWAKETLGLAIKGQPKKADLEAMIASAQAERLTENDPAILRVRVTEMRETIARIETEVKAAEERATAIEAAHMEMRNASGRIHAALIVFRDAISRLTELGLDAIWPAPLSVKVVEAAIAALAPPVRIFVFWAIGDYPIGRGYIAAESFEVARERYLKGEVDYGMSWTSVARCTDGRIAAQNAIRALAENSEAEAKTYSTTFYSISHSGHLFHFQLDGPEYTGQALVNANSFGEAKAKVMAGDIFEGNRPGDGMDVEDLAELQKALDALKENGRVEHANHILTTRTIG